MLLCLMSAFNMQAGDDDKFLLQRVTAYMQAKAHNCIVQRGNGEIIFQAGLGEKTYTATETAMQADLKKFEAALAIYARYQAQRSQEE
jgi:hypothetical protein